MRSLPLVLVVVACKKDESPPPRPAPPVSAVPIAADAAVVADAAAPLVDLFRAVPMLVTVSSTVKNPAILPAHLVDRDLNTAWNSVTGELAGSWIEIQLPGGVTAAEIRMTVGHTGHGPHGEDYFTLNPRIKSVSAWSGGKLIGRAVLDIARRTLQTIPARATGSVRIEVDEIVPGANKGWRETAISELEVWGMPPPGWTPPKTPVTPKVEVQPPPPPSPEPCAWLAEELKDHEDHEKATYEACHAATGEGAQYCGLDSPGGPACSTDTMPITAAAPWPDTAKVTCWTHDSRYGEGTCDVDVGPAAFEITSTHPSLSITELKTEQKDIIVGGAPELAVRYTTGTGREGLVVCRVKPAGCTEPFVIAGDSWSVKARFENGTMITEKAGGDPPPEALVHVPLVFK